MGPHHLGIYDSLARERLDELRAIQQRHQLLRAAQRADPAGRRAAQQPAARLRYRLARALMTLASHLDPELSAPRRRRSPSHA